MRILPVLILVASITGCDSDRGVIAPLEIAEDQAGAIARENSEPDSLETDSFRIGNKEIRDEMLDLFDKNNIQYTLSDNNLITISYCNIFNYNPIHNSSNKPRCTINLCCNI